MPNATSRYNIKFNLLLDNDDDGKLIALAQADDTSKARLCRGLIRSAYTMKFEKQPICADGQTCRCPHAHVYAPSLPTNVQQTAAPMDSPAARDGERIHNV